MYFPAIHQGFIRKINPCLCRETIFSPGECKFTCIVIEQLATGQFLDPKTANIFTISGMVHVHENKAVTSKKGKMAEILQSH